MAGFEPNYTVLAFVFFKKFVYLELIALLAGLRLILGRGKARWPAGAALALAGLGIWASFAPALGQAQGPLYATLARALAHGGGMAALLAVSAVFLLSALVPERRGRWIDALHLVLLAGLLGLWLATSV